MGIIGNQELETRLRNLCAERERTPILFLIGAGFSVSGGMPTARSTAGILARYLRLAEEGLQPSYSEVVREYFLGKIDVDQELDRHSKRRGLGYASVYQELFADNGRIFPSGLLSRRRFIEALVEQANAYRYGYNFESILLSLLFRKLRHDKVGPKSDLILTTNFDDLLPAGFRLTGNSCRIIEDLSIITKEDLNAEHPRIMYLHGHYLNYRLVNTDADLAAAWGAQLSGVFARFGERATLIVLGYAGWEVPVMDSLQSALSAGAFPGGIIWFAYPDKKALSPLVDRLRGAASVDVVEGVNALAALSKMCEAVDCDVAGELEFVREEWGRRSGDFARRWAQIRMEQKGLAPVVTLREFQRQLRAPAYPVVEEAALKAGRDGRYAGLALELVQSALRSQQARSREELGDLLYWRGKLRLDYTSMIMGAVSDFQRAVDFGTQYQVEAVLGLMEVHVRAGDAKKAARLLLHACRSRRTGTTETRIRCHLACSRYFFFTDSPRRALFAAKRAEVLARTHAGRVEPELLWEALFRRSMALLYAGEAANALAVAESLPPPIEPGAGALYGMIVRSHAALARNETETAKALFDAALERAHEGPRLLYIGAILFQLADCAFYEADVDEACRLSADAHRYLNFAGDLCGAINAAIWGTLFRLYGEELDAEDWDRSNPLLREFESFEQLAQLVFYWAEFILACLCRRKKNPRARQHWDVAQKEAVRLEAELFRRLAPDTPVEDLSPAENTDHRLLFIVAFHRRVFSLLALSYFGDKASRRVRAKLRNILLEALVYSLDDGDPRVSMMALLAGYRMMVLGIADHFQLAVLKKLAGVTTFDRGEVKKVCMARGYWYLLPLLEDDEEEA